MIPVSGTYTYAVGEEVVVRLRDVDVFNLDYLAAIPRALLPDWAIARVTSLITGGPCESYVLRMELRELNCLCVVDGAAIEGTA